jgi:glycosyltransferase involved in cell wall biosynthesis
MKVLFLYAGRRKKIFEEYKERIGPDTELLGLNYMDELGIEADFLENKWTDFFRKISFHLTELPAILKIRQYDIVYSGSGLFLLFLIKYILRWKKPRFVMMNSFLCRLLQKKRGLAGFFVRKAIASSDAIVCPVSAQKAILEKEGFNPEKIHSIHCSVDGHYYENRGEGPRVIKDRYILSIGRDLGRDYPTLLRAVGKTDIPAIIGAMKRNFPKDTIFPKNVQVDFFPREKIPALLHDAEFVVIPTYDNKRNMGSDFCGQFSILEAMMAGKAVITSAFADSVIPNVTGIVVPPEDSAALEKAILRLWNNPAEAKKMGEAGAKRAKDLFTTKQFAEKLSLVFKKVAG